MNSAAGRPDRRAIIAGMLVIRSAQMTVLADRYIESRALDYLRESIPEVCGATPERELREIIRFGRARSRQYGFEDEYDFFRYLNLMFMFGFEFDNDPQHPWAKETLNSLGVVPASKMDLLTGHALLRCLRSEQERGRES